VGRQIRIYMLGSDYDKFLEYVLRDGDVILTEMVSYSSEVAPTRITAGAQWLCLWKRSFLPSLTRSKVPSPKHEPFRVDEAKLPVLELSSSFETRWATRPAIVQGRVYGVFDGKPATFECWYEGLVRWIRGHFRKSPTSLGGYLGPEAWECYARGAYLLPSFIPPRTQQWLKEIGKQHRK